MMAKNKTGTRDQPSHRFHLRLGYDVTRRLGKRVACSPVIIECVCYGSRQRPTNEYEPDS